MEWLVPYFGESPVVLSENKLKRMMSAPIGSIQGHEERKEYIISHAFELEVGDNIIYVEEAGEVGGNDVIITNRFQGLGCVITPTIYNNWG